MRLLGAQVTNYKSIDDSGWVEFTNVTCLVGKNESGKTAFLRALYKFNPISKLNSKFDYLLEYPRKGYQKYKLTHESNPSEVVKVHFELSDHEVEELEDEFGKEVLISRVIEGTRLYNNQWSVNVQLNETLT